MFFKKIILGLILGLIIATLPAQLAFGHAQNLGANPAPNSVVTGVKNVSVNFNEKVKASPEKFQVFTSSGKQVKGKFTSTNSGKGINMALPKPLKQGSYYARYSVESADGHIISESWGFIVKSSFKPSFNTVLKSNTGKTLNLKGTPEGSGVVVVKLDADSLSFRSQKNGVTLFATSTAKGEFNIVLPSKGSWLVSAGVSDGKFKEEKYTGSIIIK